MKKNTALLPAFCLVCLPLLLAACPRHTVPSAGQGLPPCPPQKEQQHKAQWYASQHRYQLRHEGTVRFGTVSMPVTGLLRLDIPASQARAVLLTSMGMKLLDIHLASAAPDDYKVLFAHPLLERLPDFIPHTANAIALIFLRCFPQPQNTATYSVMNPAMSSMTATTPLTPTTPVTPPPISVDRQCEYTEICGDTRIHTRFSAHNTLLSRHITTPGLLPQLLYDITYQDSIPLGTMHSVPSEAVNFPQKIQITDRTNNYTVFLQLVSGKQESTTKQPVTKQREKQ